MTLSVQNLSFHWTVTSHNLANSHNPAQEQDETRKKGLESMLETKKEAAIAAALAGILQCPALLPKNVVYLLNDMLTQQADKRHTCSMMQQECIIIVLTLLCSTCLYSYKKGPYHITLE